MLNCNIDAHLNNALLCSRNYSFMCLSISNWVQSCHQLLDNCDMCAAARMWPYITEAGERQARAMLPDMLQQNKPTWMTTLKLDQSVSILLATSA